MNAKQNTGTNLTIKPAVVLPNEVAQNINTQANENIFASTGQPQTQRNGADEGVGSEITDGEDA